jgi:hypothetical protein
VQFLLLAQSAFAPHAAPSAQVGEHAGVAHFPAVHSREPQSAAVPHGAARMQAGAQAGSVHFPLVHVPDAQSPLAPQPLPTAHAGLQAGTPHLLPAAQTSEPQFAHVDIVAVVQLLEPSLQFGAQPPPAVGVHLPLVQARLAAPPQSAVTPQSAPSPQLGEHMGGAHLPAVHTPDSQS